MNTLLAMREAVERSAQGLEVDVHLSSDGGLVLIHDATVERTAAGTGAVPEKTLADLRELDAAHWWVLAGSTTWASGTTSGLRRHRHLRTGPRPQRQVLPPACAEETAAWFDFLSV